MKYDAVVIGSGAGGAAAAWRLVEGGARVLMLEAGPAFNPQQDYPLTGEDWELRKFPRKPGSMGHYSFAPLQKLEARWDSLRSWNKVHGRANPGDYRGLSGAGYHHARGVGGSTLRFTGESHRLNPEAMAMQSRFGVAADWPLTYRELEPYYQQVEHLVGVAGPEDQGDRWRSQAFPLPAHPLSSGAKKICEHSPLLWQANSRAALSQAYDNRPACNYCGNCSRGCPRGDKGSTDVTFIRRAKASGRLTLLSESTVVAMQQAKGRVTSLDYVDAAGKPTRLALADKLLVLAAGAIETPRLLLMSGNLANRSGQVGKNFMETSFWTSVGLVEGLTDSFKTLPSDLVCWDFNRPDSIDGVIGGCRFSTATAEADALGPIGYGTRLVDGWGAQLKADLRCRVGSAIAIGGIGESLPNPRSYVDLDPRHRDKWGRPLARIHSFLTDMDARRMDFMAGICRSTLQRLGSVSLVEEYGSYDFFSSTHVFGTCRMGNDPNTSVVDSSGRSHDLENLYITDASVFASTGGGESPSLTVQALAIRAMDSLIKKV